MRTLLSYCFALIISYAWANAPGVGKWKVEHRRAILMLSYQQTASIDNETTTSEIAFLCDQDNEFGIVGVMLVPFDGTFESDQDQIPLLILREADDIGRSDLSQRWRNADEFLSQIHLTT
jgi:hypothetical protein